MVITYTIKGAKADLDTFNDKVDWLGLWKLAHSTMTQHREDEKTLCISLASSIPSYLKELRVHEFDEFEQALSKGCKLYNVQIVKKQ